MDNNDNKMGFVDYLWAAFMFMLAMAAASCVSEENQTVATRYINLFVLGGKCIIMNVMPIKQERIRMK